MEELTASQPATFDPFSVAYKQDRYRALAALRTRDPVHISPLGFALLTRYDDVLGVLRSRDFGVLETAAEDRFPKGSRIGQICRSAFLFRNAPHHGRLRSTVNRAFSPRRVSGLSRLVSQHVDIALDQFEASGGGEVVEDLAYPIPLAMICDVVGIPAEDRALVLEWSRALCPTLEPIVSLDVAEQLSDAAEEFGRYLLDVVRRRAWCDDESVLAACAHALSEGAMNDDELIASIVLVLAAGQETTSSLIGTGLLQLISSPDQFDGLRRDSGLAEAAVEEMLRYESPIAMYLRWARTDVRIGDVDIAQGEPVALHIGAANRDPEVFARPEVFDIYEGRSPHLAFGEGVHRCLGAALARVELVTLFRGISERGWSLRLDREPVWKETLTVRALASLPASLVARD